MGNPAGDNISNLAARLLDSQVQEVHTGISFQLKDSEQLRADSALLAINW